MSAENYGQDNDDVMLLGVHQDDELLTLLSVVPLDASAPVGALAELLLRWRRDVDSVPLPADPNTYA